MDLKDVRVNQNHRSCGQVSTQSPNPITRQSPLLRPLVFAKVKAVFVIQRSPVQNGRKQVMDLLHNYSNHGWLGFQAWAVRIMQNGQILNSRIKIV